MLTLVGYVNLRQAFNKFPLFKISEIFTILLLCELDELGIYKGDNFGVTLFLSRYIHESSSEKESTLKGNTLLPN